jgi:hypothetical protein
LKPLRQRRELVLSNLHRRFQWLESYLVTGRLTGNFPGGTAELQWRFTVHGDLISRLEIAP